MGRKYEWMTWDNEVSVLFESSGHLFGVNGVRRVSITFLHIRNEVVWLPWGHVMIGKEERVFCQGSLLFLWRNLPRHSFWSVEGSMNGGTMPNVKHLPIGRSLFASTSGSWRARVEIGSYVFLFEKQTEIYNWSRVTLLRYNRVCNWMDVIGKICNESNNVLKWKKCLFGSYLICSIVVLFGMECILEGLTLISRCSRINYV